MDLQGSWAFELDAKNEGIKDKYWNKVLVDNVILPGTTDSNQKGDKNISMTETTFLSRRFKYEGAAWYSREVIIPEAWKNKKIFLFLERTRPTIVWVDGVKVGECKYLSTPHRYDLTSYLTSGKHKITIRVDNGVSIPQQIRSSSHACT